MRKSIFIQWILPLTLIILFAPFSAWLDLKVSTFFFDGKGAFVSARILDFFFIFGELFGFLIGIVASCALVFSIIYCKWVQLRLPALFLVASLIIGPGLIVNVAMKQFWGRPRPLQVQEFGGKHIFRPFWAPKFSVYPQHGLRSFPSGHSSMGFYNMAFIFIGRRHRIKSIRFLGIGLTCFWGLGLMFTRIAQGGHFLSDVLISPILMFWTMLALDHFLYGNHRRSVQIRKHILALPDDHIYF